jgi:uncharacterized protein YlxP (DUF503 family)
VILDAPARPSNVHVLPLRQPAPEPLDMSANGFAGLMVLDIHLPASQSLKDKRQPLRSVRQRLRDAGFSVSEVDHHDKWQRAQVAVSIVARGSGDVERLLDDALRTFESRPELEVSVRQRTVLAIQEYE